MATTQQRDYFAEILLPEIGKNAAKLPDHALSGFLSIQGHLYNNELMVVGRATNGWIDESPTPNKFTDQVTAKKYASKVFEETQGNGSCPMEWVSNQWGSQAESTNYYNTKKSSFWRVTRKVLTELNIVKNDDERWSSHLVWSNLYKVAPSSGGNPSKTLRDIQMPVCKYFLREELSNYHPRRVLLLTGQNWAEPFLKDIETSSTTIPAFKYVETCSQKRYSDGGTTKIVVAAHPQGKTESIWVREVIDAFKL
jgi:hypothetical protein